jgi:hypothetical protein
MSIAATLAPFCFKISVVAFPIPEAAPVTVFLGKEEKENPSDR